MSTTSIIAGDASRANRDRVFDCPYCGAKFIGHSTDTGFTQATPAEMAELGISAKITCPTCSNTAVSALGSGGEIQTIQELLILSLPSKTLYKPGDKFATTGLVLGVRNSDGSVGSVALTDCTFSPATSADLTTSDKKVTVTHTASSKTVDVPIRVENAQIRKLNLKLAQPVYTYTGSSITPTVEGFDSDTMTKGGNTSKTSVGEYAITVTPKTGYCWEDGTTDAVSLAWAIVNAIPTVTAPVPVADLVYTGAAQALVIAGSTTGGTMKYSLDGESYSTSVPTGTDAGAYTVYYRVDGGSNYADVPAATVEARIAAAE